METAQSIIKKFADNQNKTVKYWYKFSSFCDANALYTSAGWTEKSGRHKFYSEGEVRCDGNRVKTLAYRWGHVFSNNEYYNKSEATYNSILWDGDKYVQYSRPAGHNLSLPDHATIYGNKTEADKTRNRDLLIMGDGGKFMEGYVDGNRMRIDALFFTPKN